MDIELKDDMIVEVKPYRLNARDRNDLDDVITKYMQAGIITETESAFDSPAF